MLTFNLKKEWFEKIKSGEKTHEYREYKPYWRNRLEKCIGDDFSATRLRFGNTVVIEYPHYITFVCGYAPKGDKNKRLKARLISIRLIDGRETDLHIDKPVYDIKFELIGDKKMTNKEQIIIDTNKYFVEVIDESKSTIGYYVVHPEELLREIIKQNKQLARKTQELEQYKKSKQASYETMQREWNEATLKNRTLKQECEDLKRQIKNEKEAAKSEIEIYNDTCGRLKEENDTLYLERKALNNVINDLKLTLKKKEFELDRCRKALEEIEGIASKDYYDDTWADISIKIDKILNIINKAKGEES